MKVLSVTAILSCLVALVYSVQVQNPGEQDNEITAAGIEPQQPSTTQAVSPFGVPAEYQLTLDFNSTTSLIDLGDGFLFRPAESGIPPPPIPPRSHARPSPYGSNAFQASADVESSGNYDGDSDSEYIGTGTSNGAGNGTGTSARARNYTGTRNGNPLPNTHPSTPRTPRTPQSQVPPSIHIDTHRIPPLVICGSLRSLPPPLPRMYTRREISALIARALADLGPDVHPNERSLGSRWPRPYLAGQTRAVIFASLGAPSTGTGTNDVVSTTTTTTGMAASVLGGMGVAGGSMMTGASIGRPLEYPARFRRGAPPVPENLLDSVVFDRAGRYIGMLRYRETGHWDWCYPRAVADASRSRDRGRGRGRGEGEGESGDGNGIDDGSPRYANGSLRARMLNPGAFAPVVVHNVLDRWIQEYGSGNFQPPPPPPPGGFGI